MLLGKFSIVLNGQEMKQNLVTQLPSLKNIRAKDEKKILVSK